MRGIACLLLFALAAPALHAEPQATLSGRVLNGRHPVARARVRALPAPTEYGQEKPLKAETWTDDDGAFRFDGLRPGWTYSVVVDRSFFAPYRQLVEVPARLRIRLRPGAESSGRVVDTAGKPVEGALVRLFSPYSSAPEGWRDPEMFVPLEAFTGPDGRFVRQNLGPGRYDLQVSGEGLAPRLISGLEVKERDRFLKVGDIRMEPGAVIEGIVTDAEGRRVEGAQVGFTGSTSDPRSTDRYEPVKSGPDGTFRMESLPPGERFDLWISAPGYVSAQARVEAPTPYPVSVTLQRDRTLAIRVVDPEKRPVPEAYVSRVQVTSTSQSVGTLGQTDAEGLFRLKGLDSRTVDVLIQAKGFRTVHVQQIPVDSEAGPVEIVLDRGAVLEGQVLDGDGNPMPEVLVDARRIPSEPFIGLAPVATDREGRYRLAGIGAGQYEVVADRLGLASKARGSVEIGVEGDHHLDLQLPAGISVSGQVVDGQGAPVPEARVTLTALDGEGNVARAIARIDGTFAFQVVPDGEFRLAAAASGFAPARVPDDLRVSGGPIAGLILTLRPGVAISGRLVGYDTARRPRARVYARSAETPRPTFLSGTVDRYGVYTISNASPGPWIVKVDLSDGRFVEEQVDVTDQPVALDFDLEQATRRNRP